MTRRPTGSTPWRARRTACWRSAEGNVFDVLNRGVRAHPDRAAPWHATGGRRIEASQLLGIGRNTITRKIQELGLENGRSVEREEDQG